MNFLQMSQRLASLAAVAGTPSAVTGQAGEMGRIVTWVQQAWVDIQSLRQDWPFLWMEATPFSTASGTQIYELETDLMSIVDDYVYLNDGTQDRRLSYLQFTDFRSQYGRSNDQGMPTHFTVRPDGNISFYPTPDDAYSVSYDYYRKPVVLSENTDTPSIPERHHMMIVYLALTYYGQYEEAGDVIQLSNMEYQKRLTNFSNEVLPDVGIGAAFV